MPFDLDTRITALEAEGLDIDRQLVCFLARLDEDTATAFLKGHGIITPFDDVGSHVQSIKAMQELADQLRQSRHREPPSPAPEI